MNWYSEITQDLGSLPQFLGYYETELIDARAEVKLGGSLEKNISALPGIVEHRFTQLQEIEAILNYMNIRLRGIKYKHFKDFKEAHALALTARELDKYVDGEQEVIDYEILINEVALMRNKWLGIMKGLENKQWMAGHVVKLRSVGLEEVVI